MPVLSMRRLASLPAVHEVLSDPRFEQAAAALADPYRTRLVRAAIDRVRQRLRASALDGQAPDPADPAQIADTVVRQCVRDAERLRRPFPQRVVNGTGVLIHTNLGRAPLGDLAALLADPALAGYADLEWDRDTGARGSRDAPLQRQLRLLTGAEAALVVNNCASALFLALNTLARGREVLVSRSELVEIGGSFRVPDIMEASGCRLVEVGTTNKTRLSDFARRARDGDSVLLKVHQSNFVQRGFVEAVSVAELVELGRERGIPVIEDNGSGLLDTHGAPFLADEPAVLPSLRAGVDVVCSSADKLFGSVQAGVLLGRAEPIAAMRSNPLYRVLRLDKVRIALLDRTLKQYLAGRGEDLALWHLFHTPLEQLQARAAQLRLPGAGSRWAHCRIVPLRATLGGGANPEATFPSVGLELTHRDQAADALKRRFATRSVPIVGYVHDGRFHLDLRTVFPADLPEIQQALDHFA